MEPNRDSGDWLPGVKTCPHRAEPCGNPLDADEAMRADQVSRTGKGFLAIETAKQARKHAHNVASECKTPPGECPLERHFGKDRHKVLEDLSGPESK